MSKVREYFVNRISSSSHLNFSHKIEILVWNHNESRPSLRRCVNVDAMCGAEQSGMFQFVQVILYYRNGNSMFVSGVFSLVLIPMDFNLYWIAYSHLIDCNQFWSYFKHLQRALLKCIDLNLHFKLDIVAQFIDHQHSLRLFGWTKGRSHCDAFGLSKFSLPWDKLNVFDCFTRALMKLMH